MNQRFAKQIRDSSDKDSSDKTCHKEILRIRQEEYFIVVHWKECSEEEESVWSYVQYV